MSRSRSRAAVTVAAATLLALTSCSSDDPQPAAAEPAAPASDTTAQAGPIDVTIGQPFEISNQKGPTATVTVISVEVAPQCTDMFGEPTPPAGTNVALELEVQTTDNPPLKYISDVWFDELTPDGYTKNPPAANDLCIGDRESFDRDPAPNSKYRGWVLVDVSDPKSSLLMSDIWDGRTPPETHRIPITG
ncbi:hypothetical protein ACPESR_25330 [Nocardia testacea]|uniref:hypothetical protein n=1 Tax=Nocardia testacea TaxID=248551 RepID=UPI003C2D78E3